MTRTWLAGKDSRGGLLVRLALRRFVALTGMLALFAYVWIYAGHLAEAPIRSDGVSYYVYLPSWLLYQDVTLESVARECCGGTFPAFTAIVRWRATGRWVDAHPIGEAILMAPFFVAAHLLTRWSNLPPDGFSLYYQHADGLSGLVYFLLGLAIVRRLLRRHFADGVALATLATLTFGTNLFHYGVFDSSFSHAYSFFLVAALVALTDAWWTGPRWPVTLALALVAALVVLTRHPNVMFLLLVPLYDVASVRDLWRNLSALWVRRRAVLIGAVVFVAGVFPQLAMYHGATGHWLVSSYGDLGFTWSSPHLFGVLFSVQKGLFFWSPVLLFSLAGLVVARGWARRWRSGVALTLALDTYVIASWWDWQYGGSYGHRGFTDTLALFAIFVAAFFAWAAERPRARRLVAAVATLAVTLSIVQMLQYWLHVIPFADTTWDQYRRLFLKFH